MTREEAREILTHNWTRVDNPNYSESELDEAFFMAIEALQTDAVKRVDCSSFLLWLLEEIMDEENWELNAVADGEIIARKLKKLGLLEVKDGYYHRIFDENVWVVRCKDCRYFKKIAERSDSGLCHRDIVASVWIENGYCSRGERKGGDDE